MTDGRTGKLVFFCMTQIYQSLTRPGIWCGWDEGILVLFDQGTRVLLLPEGTKFFAAKTPGGRAVTVLRA